MNIPYMCKPRVIVVCGPTGIGKTLLSLELARNFNGGIISADSMQIYRHMDIGTAKPSPSEQAEAPHFMIDVADPDESYDAATYAKEARRAVLNLEKQGKLPLIIGGTGLYIKALLYGLFEASPSSTHIRRQLRQESDLKGSRHLHDRLAAYDPEAAGRIHPNDSYRIIRALEVYFLTGRPISEYQKKHSFKDQPFHALKIGLYMDRQALYDRINERTEKMLENGLLSEVKSLLEMGYSPGLKSMQSLGYRHVVNYLQGRLSWRQAVDQIKRDTRRYAKRQLVWFRKDTELNWMNPEDIYGICSLVRRFISATG